jgi:hypothetical protein
MIEEARQARDAGRSGEARLAYADAAELARSEQDGDLRAHALRHVSDLAREHGETGQALTAAEEAVALYRAMPHCRPLDLANALRLNALAPDDFARGYEAALRWGEARDLYASEQVQAGVEECDRHL